MDSDIQPNGDNFIPVDYEYHTEEQTFCFDEDCLCHTNTQVIGGLSLLVVILGSVIVFLRHWRDDQVQGVVVTDLARLSRSSEELMLLVQEMERHILRFTL